MTTFGVLPVRVFNLLREIPAVEFVNQIPQAVVDVACHAIRIVFAVVAVVDRNETDTEEGEYLLQIVAHLHIVTAKARKILDDDAVNFPTAHHLQHRLDPGPFKVGAATSIILKLQDLICFKLRMRLQIAV